MGKTQQLLTKIQMYYKERGMQHVNSNMIQNKLTPQRSFITKSGSYTVCDSRVIFFPQHE